MARTSNFGKASLTVCLALAVGGALAACRDAVGPLPPDAVRLQPPAVFERWWAMTEQCSRHTGDFGAVQWYHAPGSQVKLDGDWVQGYWTSRGNAVVLAEDFEKTGSLVRHEMLHALLRIQGHPREEFLGACAGLVDCAGSCISDAGPWQHPLGAIIVSPDSISLSSVSTVMPVERDGDRFFSFRIRVTNPATHPIIVAPPPNLDPTVFGYDVRGANGSGGISSTELVSDSSRISFAAHESKEWMYEFLIADRFTYSSLPAGSYVVRGSYLHRWTDGDYVTLTR